MRRLARIIRDHPVVFLVLTAAVWIVLTDEFFGPASMRHAARDVSHVTLVAFLLLGGYLAFRDAGSRRRPVAREQSERMAREVREWLPINVDDPDELREYLADHDVSCVKCGYNLRGLRGDACPECGGPVVGAELFQLATFGIPNSLDVLAPTLGTPRWSKPRKRTPFWMRTVAVVLAASSLCCRSSASWA
ncbi:MAG: hypothetical protein K2Q20_14535 [Phycisphaerales bacterium]|nr:hypothetical protein [Phycisphaerales bacterium]